MPKFGALLRKARKQAKKTLREVAEVCDWSIVYQSDLERGNRRPPTRDKIMIASEFLGVDPRPLLTAAAEERGAIELDLDVGSRKKNVGVALMQAWTDLDEGDLDEITSVLARRGLLHYDLAEMDLRTLAAALAFGREVEEAEESEEAKVA